MFDAVALPRSTPRSRQLFIAVSAALHGLVVLALAVGAMWRIDKLTPDKTQTVFVKAGAPPGPPAAAPPAAAVAKKAQAPTKVRPRDLTQPVIAKLETDEPVMAFDGDPNATGEAGATGSGGGGGGNCGAGPCIGVGIGDGDLPFGEIAPPKAPTPPPAAEIIPPNMVEGLRVAGNAQIAPPEQVKVQMVREDKNQAVASVKMCLTTTGAVESLSLIKGTGYDGYDSLIRSEMQKWRYKPYRVDGRPVPVCTVVTFVFRMR